MNHEHNFSVHFWGVRGSHPVPGENTTRYGGNTSCVEVRAGGETLVFDAGSGIIGLGKVLAAQARPETENANLAIKLFFSHLHHDHTQGLPFFNPLYIPGAELDFYVPNIFGRGPDEILQEVMAAPHFPVSFQMTAANKRLHTVRETSALQLGGEDGPRVLAMRSYAHPQGVMIYRVDWQGWSMVYATDTEGYVNGDQRLVEFSRGADLLIHDAQYTQEHYVGRLAGAPVTQGFGHSTAQMACETAQAAGVGQLLLFHHDPNYADSTIVEIERQARQTFPNALAAREGMCVQLARKPAQNQAEETLAVAKIQRSRPQGKAWAGA
jgi:phosphoribosyl 1,2-cyclic phosphodiesterase